MGMSSEETDDDNANQHEQGNSEQTEGTKQSQSRKS